MTSSSRLRAAPGAAPRPQVARAVPAPFRTPVRGHAFAARPPGAPPLAAGQPVRLVRERDNPRDPLAVAVWVGAGAPWRAGYLDRSVAARLAPRLDDGQRFTAELEGWVDAPDGAWRRPLLVVRPASPPPEAPADDRARRRAASPPRSGTGEAPPTPLAARPPGVTRRTLPARPGRPVP